MPLSLYSKDSMDALLADKLDLAGGTMTGGLTLSASGIIFSDATYLTTAPAGSTLAADQLTAGVVAANPTAGPTTAGDVLQYDGAVLIWAPGGGGGSFLPLAGGAMDADAEVTLSDTSNHDSELAGWGLGVQLTNDHAQGTTVEYNGLNTYDSSGNLHINPTGITFPDATTQTTAGYPNTNPNGFQTSTDVSTYVGANAYPLSGNPSGFLTSVPARTVNNLNGVGSYYLDLSDNNNIIYVNGSSTTVYVYDDGVTAYPNGFEVTICVDNTSAHQVTGTGSMSGTSFINGTSSAIGLNQYMMKLVKVAANTWFIA